MDLKDIQELIKFVAKSGATEVELEIDNVKISIKSPAKKRRGATDEITAVIQQAPTTQPPIVQQAPIVQQHQLCNRHQLCFSRKYIVK